MKRYLKITKYICLFAFVCSASAFWAQNFDDVVPEDMRIEYGITAIVCFIFYLVFNETDEITT